MAKQAGSILIRGTLDDLTFYIMDGKGYVRRKSRLTRKDFRRRPCFARSRESAARFGQASRLAGRVYRSLEREQRRYTLFCLLKREAIALMRFGAWTEVEVMEKLHACLQAEASGEVVNAKREERHQGCVRGKEGQGGWARSGKRKGNGVKVRRPAVPEGLRRLRPRQNVQVRRPRRGRRFAPV